jgi:hypothetical protein
MRRPPGPACTASPARKGIYSNNTTHTLKPRPRISQPATAPAWGVS